MLLPVVSSGWKLIKPKFWFRYRQASMDSFASVSATFANAIDTITVIGYMTHNCDLSTIIHAVHMGFAVEFLSDATGSLPYANSAGYASAEEIHRVVSIILQSRFAAVLKTAEWIDCLKTGSLPERDTPYASNQRALARNAA